MSQAYRVRPSELLGVTDSFRAFTVDRAVWMFAAAIERDQDIAAGGLPKTAKQNTIEQVRQRVLDRYLGIDPAKVPGRFRDPGTASRRR